MNLSGTVVTLQSRDYKATLVSVGAAIAGLSYKGKDICLSHDVNQVAPASMGKTLVPWPNRITDAKYSWHGNSYLLWTNDYATPAASHGLCSYEHFDIAKQSETQVIFKHIIAARAGYPFVLECQVKYSLEDGNGTKGNEGGLVCEISVTNICDRSAPVGIGSHPYLTCNNVVNDHCALSFSHKIYRQNFDTKFNLQGEIDDHLNNCIEQAQLIGEQRLDNCFRVDHKGEMWWAEISNNGLVAGVKSDSPFLQFFTAEKLERKGFAIEPMSCNVNAFNLQSEESLALAPKATKTLAFTIYGR